jgi:hypothetical protein
VVAFGIYKRDLKIFLERSLRTKEKELFLSLYELQGFTFSTAVRRIGDKNYPESTAKCILKRFKQFNLVDFGNQNSKGKPLIFTDLGNSFFKILRGELE